jgi:hypothetical protein
MKWLRFSLLVFLLFFILAYQLRIYRTLTWRAHETIIPNCRVETRVH